MRAAILTGLYLCAIPIAISQDVERIDSEDIASTGLTIYPDNLGFVRETRRVDIPAGIVDIRFFGVSDMIIPESAVLEDFEGLRLEGNFDSDLITPAKLIERSVGERITIRRFNPVTRDFDLIDAELISAAPNANGAISAIFSTADGIEGYKCSGLIESIILSNLPDNLHAIPVLSTRVSSKTAGPKDITLTYMTRGLGWSADYRMDVGKEKDEVGLLGWLTLTNETSKSFKETDLSVVAGTLNRVRGGDQSNNTSTWTRVANCSYANIRRLPSVTSSRSQLFADVGGHSFDEIIVTGAKLASVREAKQEDLGDYKLYRAPQAVSVEPYQTKQIAFLSKDNVALKQGNKYRWTLSDIKKGRSIDTPIEGRLIYELDNSLTGNLARPLPAGTVRAMSKTEDGRHVFIGEDTITNKPVGIPIELEMAKSFHVTAQFIVIGETEDKVEIRVDVKNTTDTKIVAEFDFDILENVKVKRRLKRKSLSRTDKIYALTVPAQDTVTFSFKARNIEY